MTNINKIQLSMIYDNKKLNISYYDENVLEKEELYAGKFCAALDRQHPRDLFDVMQLFENEIEFSEKFIHCFIVYALGHNRPLHELVDCTIKNNTKKATKKICTNKLDITFTRGKICTLNTTFFTKKLYSVSEFVAEFQASEKKNQGISPLANQSI